MSISTTLKNQVIDFIKGLEAVQSCYGHIELNPDGFPAVMVTPGDMQGEFVSNADNSRIYSFRITVVFPTGQDFIKDGSVNREEFAEETVATVLDEIINALDTNFMLEGTPTLFADAADLQWGTADLDVGEAKAAEITSKIYTEYRVQ